MRHSKAKSEVIAPVNPPAIISATPTSTSSTAAPETKVQEYEAAISILQAENSALVGDVANLTAEVEKLKATQTRTGPQLPPDLPSSALRQFLTTSAISAGDKPPTRAPPSVPTRPPPVPKQVPLTSVVHNV